MIFLYELDAAVPQYRLYLIDEQDLNSSYKLERHRIFFRQKFVCVPDLYVETKLPVSLCSPIIKKGGTFSVLEFRIWVLNSKRCKSEKVIQIGV